MFRSFYFRCAVVTVVNGNLAQALEGRTPAVSPRRGRGI